LHVMCAKIVPKKTERERRDEVLRSIEDPRMDDSEAVRVLRKHLTWKDWLVSDLLRYWYGIGVLAAFVFTVLGLAEAFHVRDTVGVFFVLACGVFVLVLGFYGYRLLWPEGILTKREHWWRMFRGRT